MTNNPFIGYVKFPVMRAVSRFTAVNTVTEQGIKNVKGLDIGFNSHSTLHKTMIN